MPTIHIVEIADTDPNTGTLTYDLDDDHLTADQIKTLADAAEERGSYAVIDADTDGNDVASYFGDYAACQKDIADHPAGEGLTRRTVLVIRWSMSEPEELS